MKIRLSILLLALCSIATASGYSDHYRGSYPGAEMIEGAGHFVTVENGDCKNQEDGFYAEGIERLYRSHLFYNPFMCINGVNYKIYSRLVPDLVNIGGYLCKVAHVFGTGSSASSPYPHVGIKAYRGPQQGVVLEKGKISEKRVLQEYDYIKYFACE